MQADWMNQVVEIVGPQGQKGVFIPAPLWRELLALIEDRLDARLMEQVERTDIFVPWEEAERWLDEGGDVPG